MNNSRIQRQYFLIAGLICLLFSLLLPDISRAVSIQANPATTELESPVTFTVTVQFKPSFGRLTMRTVWLGIYFGDGTQRNSQVSGMPGETKVTVVRHAYQRSGVYTARAEVDSSLVVPPGSAAVRVTVRRAISPDVPDGVVGERYNHSLKENFGDDARNYSIVANRLPPGLSLASSGQISGTPTARGSYSFTVQAHYRSGPVTQQFTLKVNPGRLEMAVEPAAMTLTENGRMTQPVSFRVVHPSVPLAGNVTSARGEFVQNGRALGFFSRPLNVNLNQPRSQVTETPLIPAAVLQAVRASGNPVFSYRRTFTSPNLGPAAVLGVQLRLPDQISTALPQGRVGEMYNHSLRSNLGARTSNYSLAGNRLPPGLSLTPSGSITGTPNTVGNYPFTVRAQKGGASITQQFTLVVTQGRLEMAVEPAAMTLTENGRMTQPVSFRVVHPSVPLAGNVTSTRGEFVQNGRVLGFFSRPLNVNLNQPRPQVTETPLIPAAVLQAVRASGNPVFSYRRTFTSPNLGPAAVLGVQLRLPDQISTALPQGRVGEMYNHSLRSNLGSGTSNYSLAGNRLPSGLSLASSGQISGTPITVGSYPFTVRAQKGGASITQQFTLVVTQGRLEMAVEPAAISLSEDGRMNQSVSFRVVHPSVPLAGNVTSTRGEFVQNGRVLGFFSRPLNVNLNQPRPQVTETPLIPAAVLQAVRASGNPVFSYRRTFTSPNLGPDAMLRVQLRLSSSNPVVMLPAGMVGLGYDHSLRGVLGSSTQNYRLAGNRLPPGLSLDFSGRITGIATMAGNYSFTVQAQQGGQRITRNCALSVAPGKLEITTEPNSIYLTQGGQLQQRLVFRVGQPVASLNDTLHSLRGEFIQNGRIIGMLGRPLSMNLNQAHPQAAEIVVIPPAVVQEVQKSGIPEFSYRRVFTSRNFQDSHAITKLSFGTPASGDLRITGMRLYFSRNNRPQITVQRNERGLVGEVAIYYNGSGVLKGYWQVDNRRIQQVQKNLFYGKVLTLKTPAIPALPTFSEGAHCLRFIITEPEASQPGAFGFPEAFYYVEGVRASLVIEIQSTSPEDQAEIDAASTMFSWSAVPGSTSCLVEFFASGEDVPVFSAYSTKNAYTLPPVVIKQRFTETSRSYQWRVKSFNESGVLNGESKKREFLLKTP